MSKIWLYIKKFFAMIASIIFGAFKNRVDYKEEKREVNSKEDKITKSRDIVSRTSYDESPGEKSRDSYGKKKDDNDEIIYNAKRDIQKLLFIQKNITKLESEINKCEDLDEMYLLKEEWKKAKFHFNKIADQYKKVNLDERIITDIKSIIKDTDKMVVSQEKTIDNKIFKLKQDKEDKKEDLEDRSKEQIKQGISKEAKKKETIVEKKKEPEDKQKETKNAEELEKEDSKEIVIDDEVIESIEEKIEIKELEEIISDDKTVKKDDDAKVRKIPVDINRIEKKQDRLTQNRDNRALVAVAAILAQARSIAASMNLSALLQLNSTIAISSTLHINNEVRRARKEAGARVRDLNLEKVVSAVGMNPFLQARYIVANSLKEIRKLRGELRQYGNIPEVVNALNELAELEMEILMQMNELQMQNQQQQNRHR